MKDTCESTIGLFAKRSNAAVWGFTTLIAMADMISHIVFRDAGKPTLSHYMWIPLCFFTIPAVHFLCREIVRLRRKIEELEERLK